MKYGGSKLSIVNAPMVIMPSIPILITPLLSEKQEPRAARRRGGVAIKVALIKRPRFLMITSILVCLLLLAALGSCFSERSGVINIGIEGMMTIGAFTGAVLGLETGNGWLAFLGAGLAGALFGVIHAVVCISFHADQTIAGTAINFLGPGLAVFLCKAMYNNSSDTPAMDPASKLPKRPASRFPFPAQVPHR